MQRSVRFLASLTLLANLSTAAPALAASADPLSWMTGHWCTDDGGPKQVCEMTGPARGGMKLATSQTVADGKTRVYELITLSVDGPKVVAKVFLNGNAPIAFTEATRGKKTMTFENPDWPYPQRIRYWREGPRLHVEIMKLDGTKRETWSYRRVRS